MFAKTAFALILLQFVSVQEAAPVKNAVPWPNQTVTYSIINNARTLSPSDTKAAFRYAFDQWSAVIPRDFIEIPANPSQPADIQISFATWNHGDGQFFDGPGGESSHTLPNGTMHFDDDENFKKYLPGDKVDWLEKDVTWNAMHEIGHVLGLAHTMKTDSIMAPVQLKSIDSTGRYVYPTLAASDIENIQALYGARK